MINMYKIYRILYHLLAFLRMTVANTPTTNEHVLDRIEQFTFERAV